MSYLEKTESIPLKIFEEKKKQLADIRTVRSEDLFNFYIAVLGGKALRTVIQLNGVQTENSASSKIGFSFLDMDLKPAGDSSAIFSLADNLSREVFDEHGVRYPKIRLAFLHDYGTGIDEGFLLASTAIYDDLYSQQIQVLTAQAGVY